MKIDQDLHIHTNLSSCARREATVDSYIPVLRNNGITTCGFANHFWDERIPDASDWYKPQNFPHICELKDDLKKNCDCGIRLLFGAEAEYCPARHIPAITEEVAEQLDFLLVPNSHTHMTMPKAFYDDHQRHADFMLQAFMDIVTSPVAQWLTAVAHPFYAVSCPYPHETLLPLISEKDFCHAFEVAANKNIAVEINAHIFEKYTLEMMENSGYLKMFRLAKKCGCKFTFGSDAHSAATLSVFAKGMLMAELLELKETDIRRV